MQTHSGLFVFGPGFDLACATRAAIGYGKRNMDDSLNFDTLAVRAGTLRSDFNEHSEALFLT
ncbi:hypothetical protein, partial [Escherichia coli]|uniref:hypothetical protein n=1 Tax=Escherichia coli TaxID=562 RepID=UPI0017BE7414